MGSSAGIKYALLTVLGIGGFFAGAFYSVPWMIKYGIAFILLFGGLWGKEKYRVSEETGIIDIDTDDILETEIHRDKNPVKFEIQQGINKLANNLSVLGGAVMLLYAMGALPFLETWWMSCSRAFSA